MEKAKAGDTLIDTQNDDDEREVILVGRGALPGTLEVRKKSGYTYYADVRGLELPKTN